MPSPIYIYADVDNSTREVVTSTDPPTEGDKRMVAANLMLVLRINGREVYRLKCNGEWEHVSEAEIITDPDESGHDRGWHGSLQ